MQIKPGQSVFITGTGTHVGKTFITGLWARCLLEQGVNVVTQKWVQTGSDLDRDIDTHDLLVQHRYSDTYSQDRCPYLLTLPASPHLAARHAGITIQKEKIIQSFHRLTTDFDCVLVEGAGGVLVPYSESEYLIDIAKDLDLPVLVVSSVELGSINQTLLTIEALKKRQMPIVGVMFTSPTGEVLPEIVADTPRIVAKLTGEKICGTLPYKSDFEQAYALFKRCVSL